MVPVGDNSVGATGSSTLNTSAALHGPRPAASRALSCHLYTSRPSVDTGVTAHGVVEHTSGLYHLWSTVRVSFQTRIS